MVILYPAVKERLAEISVKLVMRARTRTVNLCARRFNAIVLNTAHKSA